MAPLSLKAESDKQKLTLSNLAVQVKRLEPRTPKFINIHYG